MLKNIIAFAIKYLCVNRKGKLTALGKNIYALCSFIFQHLSDIKRHDNMLKLECKFMERYDGKIPANADFNEMDIIYDVGANDGADTEYFLKKSCRVVAIEANAALAARMRCRFSEAVADGRLKILNVAVAESEGEVPFFIDGVRDGLSCLYEPTPDMINPSRVLVPAENLAHIISGHGNPYCVKIDIEGFDHLALRQIFQHGIRPRYVSAECHSMEPVWLMVNAGYRLFKIIEGRFVDRPYFNNAVISASGSCVEHSFSLRSCGPVAQDIPGEWMGTHEMLRYFEENGVGWKDLHGKWQEQVSIY